MSNGEYIGLKREDADAAPVDDLAAASAESGAEIPECLHCALRAAVHQWAGKHAKTIDGKKLLDPVYFSTSVAEMFGDFLNAILGDTASRMNALSILNSTVMPMIGFDASQITNGEADPEELKRACAGKPRTLN
jgi:hypothetical protein